MIIIITYICFNSIYVISPSREEGPTFTIASLAVISPVILRVFREICIEFSMHIADSDFKRIIRTSHHP